LRRGHADPLTAGSESSDRGVEDDLLARDRAAKDGAQRQDGVAHGARGKAVGCEAVDHVLNRHSVDRGEAQLPELGQDLGTQGLLVALSAEGL
jgi:hypothetical protein